MKELMEKVNLYNRRTTVFTSLYSFENLNEKKTRGIYGSARLNTIYFDSDKTEVEPILTLHQWCKKRDLLHCMFFSGGGFHFYIAATGDVQNKKGALTNAQVQISSDNGLKIGIDNGCDIDGHIIGNLAQMVRVPGTYNLKRKLYCIPLKESDLASIDHIKHLALLPSVGIPIYGKKAYDLTPHDSEPVTRGYDETVSDIPRGDIDIGAIDVSKFPPCINALCSEKNLKHRSRYILLVFLKALGVSRDSAIQFLRQCLDYKTFRHCVMEERQVFWIFQRNDLYFPSCETLDNWEL
jgi:hypothetical protein